ncbi:Nucleolar GTP-binding protein 2 [Mactra antiquata]
MAKTARKKPIRDSVNKAGHSMNPDRPKQADSNMRDKATIKRLKMYKNFKAIRDRKGKILQPAPYQSWLPSGSVARVDPNRKWFGNTRVISQNALQTFQDEMTKVKKDPYKLVMRQTKLPISLLNETAKNARVHVLDTESFESTFGKKKTRKRPSLKVTDMQAMVEQAQEACDSYKAEKDRDLKRDEPDFKDANIEMVFKAGQSKRIWNELHKVIDSSDVLINVLDARDPLGTRCYQVEEFLKKEKPFKHIIFVLNKVDLVPVWVTQKWVAILSAVHPTLAFHASIMNPFGKGSLINLLRQFSKLHTDKRQITVGFIGYPNVGKSSVINTLRAKKVCKVAPIAGETKVWQYITLMKRIYLVDCPGVVYPTGSTPTDCVLKGVVRVENIKTPEDYIDAMLQRVKVEYIKKTYSIISWTDHEDFLSQFARRSGKLLKGGDPDITTAAKMILNDFQRGSIPYFVRPPDSSGDADKTTDGESKIAESEEKKTTSEGDESIVKSKKVPVVHQDYKKIRVEPSFTGEDVKEITDDFVDNSDVDDDEDDDDNDDVNNDSISDSEVPDVVEDVDEAKDDNSQEKVLKKKKKNRKPKSKTVILGSKIHSIPIVKKNETKKKSKTGTAVTENDNVAIVEVKESDMLNRELLTVNDNMTKSNVKQGTIEDTEFGKKPSNSVYTVKDFANVTCVEIDPTTSSEKDNVTKDRSVTSMKDKKGKRKKFVNDDEEVNVEKLTSKKRRRMEREMRQKKIGEHFYATANVKNRRSRR